LKRIVLALSLSLCALALPAVASAHAPTGRHFGVYRYVYRHALKQFGHRAVGCELVYRCAVRPVSDDMVVASTHTLERMLHPPQTFHAVGHIPAPSLPYGQWVIPSRIVGCESTYQNLPPNSAGASGYYQIIPSTWSLFGGSPPNNAYEHSKAEQDAVAARIWDGGRGASNWVCRA
jgi:hypothetical protein